MPFPVPAAINMEFDNINSLVEKTFNAGEMDQLVQAAYHSNGQAMGANMPLLTGHTALAAMFTGLKASGVARVKLQHTDRQACDSTAHPDTVYEAGEYVFWNTAGEQVDNGKYLVLWQPSAASGAGAAGGYKMRYDCFTSSVAK